MSAARLDLASAFAPAHHRSGWAYAISGLQRLHSERGVRFESFIEKRFAWGRDPGDRHNAWEPLREPWVGVWHNPPFVPSWFNAQRQAPSDILHTDAWRESQGSCLGIFTLSRYLRTWLAERVTVPVCDLFHPTETPPIRFDLARYASAPKPKVVQVGWWLRRHSTIFNLQLPGARKLFLDIGAPWTRRILAYELEVFVNSAMRDSVEIVPFVAPDDFDNLLSESVVLLDLYDSSANNALVECIVRETPVLINRLEAAVEYLGQDYPLYFDSLEDAAAKAREPRLVSQAHEYLRALPKERFTRHFFVESIENSAIYRAM
jgi:hypothetical protein